MAHPKNRNTTMAPPPATNGHVQDPEITELEGEDHYLPQAYRWSLIGWLCGFGILVATLVWDFLAAFLFR